MRVRTLLVAVLLTLAAATAQAQPPRDVVRPRPTGSATIHGAILSRGGDVQPLRRARVSLDGIDVEYRQTAITADDGTFRFDGLPAGSYRIRAAKEPYVPAEYGTRRIGGVGTPITLRAGETRRADIRLARGGVISGRVQTPDGDPAVGLSVVAFTSRYLPSNGERRLVEASTQPIVTDDRGDFRIYGLPPGDYVVAVRPRIPIMVPLQVLTDAEVRDAMSAASASFWSVGRPGSTAPAAAPALATTVNRPSVGITQIFFPGTPFIERATVLRLGEAETRHGVDLDIQYVPLANIEGAISVPEGVERVQITMSSTGPEEFGRPARFVSTDASGRFSFRAVPPGTYTLLARVVPARSGPAAPGASHVGTAEITVAGDDISGLGIPLKPALTLSGRVVFDPPFDLPVTLSGTQAPWIPLSAANLAGFNVMPVATIEGNAFTISGLLPATYRLHRPIPGIRTPVGRWWLKSATVGGRELLDAPLELTESATDAVLSWSDSASTVSGAVRDANGRPVAQAYVIVFSRDQRGWFFNSRRIAGVRTDAQGRFSVRNLPAGEYLAVATFDVDPDEWFDAVLLKDLVPVARPITVTDGVTAIELTVQVRGR